jgi:NifB/MoaA-like Fe-S oxidoreductase
MLTVKEVAPGSIAEQIGLRPGDSLVSIDGNPVGDVIDVHFYASADTVELVWQTEGGDQRAEDGVDVGPDGLGLSFTQPTEDGIRICNNRCVFCFVDQSPARMRRTLYIKDDDFRYSFLAANFVTLTNLSDADWQKIHDQHLSPLYVSVHATELDVRRRLLGNPTAPDILEQLDRLKSWNIKVHTQVVLTPNYNDGIHLQRTVDDLAARWPTVQSLAVVPVGLTQQRFDRQEGLRQRIGEQLKRPDLDPVHRAGLVQRTAQAPQLRLLDADESKALVKWAKPLQRRFEREFGYTWLHLSDEVYLTAGVPVPGALKYDGFVQLENGIGMVRTLLDGWRRAKTQIAAGLNRPVSAIFACAKLIAPTFDQISVEMCAIPNLRARSVQVENQFFGPVVTVAGLLTARDILRATQDALPGELLFVPRAALDYEATVFLDGMTLEQFKEETPATVVVVSSITEMVSAIEAAGSAASAAMDSGTRSKSAAVVAA